MDESTKPEAKAGNGTPAVQALQPEFFKNLLGRLEDPVFVKNDKHQWIFTNEAFESLVGCSDLIGKTDGDLLPPEQVAKFYEGDNTVIRTQKSLTQEEQIGDGVYALVKKIPITLPDNTQGLFGIIFDISEYRKVQLEVEKLRLAKEQSQTDPLTGLANRRHLEEQYAVLLERNHTLNRPIGLLHIDLDYFKEINDTKGHLSGDAVLVHLSDILRQCTRSVDLIARIGGDEFVIVVDGHSLAEIEDIAQRIISAMDEPATVDNELVNISVSVGVATDDKSRLTLKQMLKFADLALYRAKHNGRGRYERFSAAIQKEHDKLRQQRDEFKQAFESGEFFPVYQPQFDAQTLDVVGVEALARWQHPQRGVLQPSEFLDIAVTERRLIDLDRVILTAAMRDAKALKTMGMSTPALSINLSPQSLAASDFIEVVKSLEPFPNRICFELVETMLLDEPSGVVTDNLDQLRALGVCLDIDDFGSGCASLLGMLEARPNRLKIDKRLVIPMVESKEHMELVKSIIQIANSLGMDTVAEGVETEAHHDLLLEMGCRYLQGFWFSYPVALDSLVKLLERRKAA